MAKQQRDIGIREVPLPHKWLILSLQHLCAMFGATILVPLLVDLSPAVALISSGLGTLAYLLITKGQVPAYLGSSFAFITPIIAVTAFGGPEAAMVGSFFVGLVYGVAALLIKVVGRKWLMTVLPPIVVGPVIMVIGLGLAGVAIDMAMMETIEQGVQVFNGTFMLVAMITLLITIVAAVFFKGFFGLVPMMFGIAGGYVTALFVGLIDFQAVYEAKWLVAPDFIVPFVTYTPTVEWTVLAIMVPIAAVTLAEHIGDQMVLSKVAGKNFLEKPGLHRSLAGDGVATMIASFLGGPPNTTYGENIGVIAITRVFSVFVIGGAALLAIVFGFSGKISALISTIPQAVMGGVSILLFGVIASSGLRMLIDNEIQLGEKRNLIISSVILVIGIGGAFVPINENVQIPGMALATIIGIVLHLVLPNKEVSYGTKSMFENEKTERKKEQAA
ncbi:solute carrier family 23 protein [Halalkalibacterium halodurans]|uniref:Uracil transporter (Permease) n=1 Tax=Halalkalibacterium halodurans (strain ATCC BAA-125 / DSM 18197 / FERM 7344 / JCM 9153 / C-125) TaxID=272558 RepID=Q9K9V5_HALH5|nr:solute carrier family 23 protein [Halalkalibacterium halodurans]MED4079686.1 solute carrier family 23 protein [Halalkalibacterium halodurans]MED4086372.1 solute carrier family 23 protein [Halalkalibacterium halodurans]MED4103283.1 solute carrier family 23 protein [Halalkalibacterium halodurans]MED4108020.1 solute carrier family 23 protein [Halalkalibacterium halodurans]MED4148323.1 solute carrier family 23 protein [Halalkalibacterium halodurans]